MKLTFWLIVADLICLSVLAVAIYAIAVMLMA